MSAKPRRHSHAIDAQFQKKVQAGIVSDPVFRDELLREGVECLLAGELETGQAILRDYIIATVDFETPSGLTHKSAT